VWRYDILFEYFIISLGIINLWGNSNIVGTWGKLLKKMCDGIFVIKCKFFTLNFFRFDIKLNICAGLYVFVLINVWYIKKWI